MCETVDTLGVGIYVIENRADDNFSRITWIIKRNMFGMIIVMSTPLFYALRNKTVFFKTSSRYMLLICEKMFGDDYLRRHNELIKCLHLHCWYKISFLGTEGLRILLFGVLY